MPEGQTTEPALTPELEAIATAGRCFPAGVGGRRSSAADTAKRS